MPQFISQPNKEEFTKDYLTHTTEETAAYFNLSYGVTRIYSKELNIKKLATPPSILTDIQKQVIVGSLLGDGCLNKTNKNNSLFIENHGESQYGYISWKATILNNFNTKVKRNYHKGSVVRANNNQIIKPGYRYSLTTMASPIFTNLEKIWYKRDHKGNYILKNGHRIKIVPNNIAITPLTLAIWFLDDGQNNPKGRFAKIYTLSFTKEECELLVSKIKNLGINCKVSKDKKEDQWTIFIGSKSYLDFIDLIKEYVQPISCLSYKIDTSKYVKPLSHVPKKLNENKVKEILKLAQEGEKLKKIAIQFEVHVETIRRIVNKKIWTHIAI